MRRLIVFILLLVNTAVFGQNIDSLWNTIEKQTSTKDTAVISTIYNLVLYIKYADPDTTIYIANKGIDLANEMNKKELIPFLIEIKGDANWQLSNLKQSLKLYKEAQKIFISVNDRNKEGYMYASIGYIYMDMDRYEEALENYQKGLNIAEETNHKELEIVTLSYLAIIYKKLNQHDKALLTYKKALAYYEKINHARNIEVCMNNIGIIFYETQQFDSAEYYYNQSLIIGRKIEDEKNIANVLLNLGNIALDQKEYSIAEKHFKESIYYNEKRNDKFQLIQNYVNVSNVYFYQEKMQKAYTYILKAKAISDNTDNIEFKISIQKHLADYFQKKKNYKQALEHYHNHTLLKDSILGLETSKQINKLAAVYENERKELEIENLEKNKELQKALISKKESKIKGQEIVQKQEKMFRIGLFTGIALLIIIAVIIYIGSRNKSKANALISLQKELVEEKNYEILASINYAKRIQAAILPPLKIVKEYLPQSFILYKPKDIVAGDFYWMEHVSNVTASAPTVVGAKQSHPNDEITSDSSNHRNDGSIEQSRNVILFAAADCTGHGVPGAMVSVICNNGLNRSLREHGLTDPGEILNKTREIVIQEFEKSEEEVKDGMDIALCSLEFEVQSSRLENETSNLEPETVALLQYAGANNPLWIIRDGELLETKANKEPIGKFESYEPYTTHTIELKKEDAIYIFSDGYADQFGGVKGKKFKSSNFKKLLLSIQHETMGRQKEILDENIEKWRGEIEQIDDVCVIGVRV